MTVDTVNGTQSTAVVHASQPTIPGPTETQALIQLAAGLGKSLYFKDVTNEHQAFAKLMFGRDLGLSATAAMTGVTTAAATINQGTANPATTSPASSAAMPRTSRAHRAIMHRVNLHPANRPPEIRRPANMPRAKADASTAASGSNSGVHPQPSRKPRPAFRPSSPRLCVLSPRNSR